MWRMIKAGLMGILLGIAGGVIFGQISYVKNFKNKAVTEIMSDAVMYDNSEDEDRVIRIKVEYDGDLDTSNRLDEFESYVGNNVMEKVQSWLGDNYNKKFSYIEMRHNLVMAMKDINEVASKAANEWGISANADSQFAYEYFDATDECPAGYYETLCISLEDR